MMFRKTTRLADTLFCKVSTIFSWQSCALVHANLFGGRNIASRGFDNGHRMNPDVAPGAIHNVQSILTKWSEYFQHKRIPEPEASAELIIAHVLGCKTLSSVASWQIVSTKKSDRINDLCSRRLLRMPVQYIIEEWDFRDLLLEMKPPVLIPRPETEELITFIKEYQVAQDLPPPRNIMDIGCGTGAIILSLAKEYPLSHCLGVDKCLVACELTRKNANNNELQVHVENVAFNDATVKDDEIFRGTYDLVVSNPPYIKTDDLVNLAPEIQQYEDVPGALDGGEDGLNIVKSILRNAKHIMSKNGLLWLEVDSSHPDHVRALTEENSEWNLQYIKTYNDFRKNPRFCLLSHY